MIQRSALAFFVLVATLQVSGPAAVEASALDDEPTLVTTTQTPSPKTAGLQTTIKVQDESGKPLTDVRIRVESAAGTSLVDAAVSGDGSVVVSQLPRGRHRAIVSDRDGVIGTAVLVVSAGRDEAVVTVPGGTRKAAFSEAIVVSAEAGSAQESARTPQSTNSISKDEIDTRAKVTLAEIGNGGA